MEWHVPPSTNENDNSCLPPRRVIIPYKPPLPTSSGPHRIPLPRSTSDGPKFSKFMATDPPQTLFLLFLGWVGSFLPYRIHSPPPAQLKLAPHIVPCLIQRADGEGPGTLLRNRQESPRFFFFAWFFMPVIFLAVIFGGI